MKYLIIAEKPELGRAIAGAIPANSDGSIVPAGSYKVLAARGHLLELKSPEDYDPALRTWSIDQLPIFFRDWGQKPREIVIKKEGKRVKKPDEDVIRRLNAIKEGLADCDCVIHAGDPDDEGQFLIDEILNHFHNTKPVLRLLINELSQDYIRNQMNHLEPNEKYLPLGIGAYARSVSDFMFGINYSRFYTKVCNSATPLSVGRVQTPTLGLVVNRDLQIENHVQRYYYTLEYTAKINNIDFPAVLIPDKESNFLEDGKVFDRSVLEELSGRVPSHHTDAVVSKADRQEDPPLPFNLVKLQTYCGAKMKLSPQQTLDITQALREKYNLITYNRSDCQYLNDEQHKEAPGVLAAIYKNLGLASPPAQVDTSRKSKCFNSDLTTAHHAIIPTKTTCDMSKLSEIERKVYEAITLFYILQFMPPKVQRKTTMRIPLFNGHVIQAESAEITDAGWLGYASPEKAASDKERTPLSGLAAGNYTCNIRDGRIVEHETQPPKRYTEYSLNEDMTRIARYVTDPEVKKLLLEKDKGKKGENGSIGTSATRAGIIQQLLVRGFIETVKDKKGSYIVSTKLGRTFYAMLPEDIKGADITARWWAIVEDIKEGAVPEDTLFDSVLGKIRETIAVKPSDNIPLEGLVTRGAPRDYSDKSLGKCPRCGRDVIEGKKGYGCVGWRDKEEPCNFTIWKENKLLAASGKTVTKAMVKGLLGEKRKTRVSGLISKGGKEYSADFVLDDNGTYANLKMLLRDKKAPGGARRPGGIARS